MVKRLVVVETPFMGDVPRNVLYARACLRDCLVNHKEYPFASHLLYTQTGVLDDNIPEERELGITAGLEWVTFAEATVVYTDLGLSGGMKAGIERAGRDGRQVEYRSLGSNWEQEHMDLVGRSENHPFVKHNVSM